MRRHPEVRWRRRVAIAIAGVIVFTFSHAVPSGPKSTDRRRQHQSGPAVESVGYGIGPVEEAHVVFGTVMWTDELSQLEGDGGRVGAVAVSLAENWTRDEDDRFAADLPFLTVLALILLSPFIYDALSALRHIQ